MAAEPQLWPENKSAIDAWLLLKVGEQAIPLSEIVIYARLNGFDALTLAKKVRQIDRRHAAHRQEVNKE